MTDEIEPRIRFGEKVRVLDGMTSIELEDVKYMEESAADEDVFRLRISGRRGILGKAFINEETLKVWNKQVRD